MVRRLSFREARMRWRMMRSEWLLPHARGARREALKEQRADRRYCLSTGKVLRNRAARERIELSTLRFSVVCSTNWATRPAGQPPECRPVGSLLPSAHATQGALTRVTSHGRTKAPDGSGSGSVRL